MGSPVVYVTWMCDSLDTFRTALTELPNVLHSNDDALSIVCYEEAPVAEGSSTFGTRFEFRKLNGREDVSLPFPDGIGPKHVKK